MMKEYIGYEVRAFAYKGAENGEPVYEQVPDEQADLFCVYGKTGQLQWEWVEDVPTRRYGEGRCKTLPKMK